MNTSFSILRQRIPRRMRRLSVAALALAVLAVPGGAPAHALGDCVVARVPAGLVLPDGSVREAATLKICLTSNFTPTSAIHKTYVDGHPIGLLRSYRGRSEGRALDRPFVLLRRSERGELSLLGYAWPDGDSMALFWLTPGAAAEAPPVVARSGAADEHRNRDGDAMPSTIEAAAVTAAATTLTHGAVKEAGSTTTLWIPGAR